MNFKKQFSLGEISYYEMLIRMLKTINLVEASDLHVVTGSVPVMRLRSEIIPLTNFPTVTPGLSRGIVEAIVDSKKGFDRAVLEGGEVDLAFSEEDVGRYRVNIYKQKGSFALAIRALPIKIKTFSDLCLPAVMKQFAYKTNGLVLVTGPTGSGKSTTLAAILDLINKTRRCHIITIEDPIEYVYDHNLSLISQREIGRDTRSFSNALRGALREDPDVILVGEMRDSETIEIALTAAETGHLVLSTLHTVGAAKTIDRIVDAFPAERRSQILSQLATVLQGVVSQVLIPRKNTRGIVAATEIMLSNTAVSNLIREGKPHQILNVLQTSTDMGMHTLDYNLEQLCRDEVISAEDALSRCQNEVIFKRVVAEMEGY